MNSEQTHKLKNELHHFVVIQLRSGHSLHAVTQALIIESQKLIDSTDVVEAIKESDLHP